MRFTRGSLVAIIALASACGPHPGTPRRASPSPAGAPEPAPSLAARVSRGMDGAQVRGALGEPARKEKVGSVAAPGATYERWVYAGGEVILLDGKVVDVVP
jgi:hypothetical protein